MKRILIVIICLVLFISCSNKSSTLDAFTYSEKIDSNQTHYQYDIKWDDYANVDVRIVTLKKDGRKHDYVITTSYVGKSGGVSIVHWEGCDCKY